MLERNHRLQVGQQGLVGYTTSKGEARVALNVGEEAVFFNNPDLPETQSEVALPLIVGQEIIGALDIQSKEKNAFSQDDIDLFSTLAAQVSIAIQNARLFSQTQQALREAEFATGQLTGQAWKNYTQATMVKGFHFDGRSSKPLKEKVSVSNEGALEIPIHVRDQEVARLILEAPEPDYQWPEDEILTIQAAAERTGLALENARLLEDAQRRASTERAIGDMSAKISASTDTEDILRTAVLELGRQLDDIKVVVELNSEEQEKA